MTDPLIAAEQLIAVRALHAKISDEYGYYCDSCLNSWGEPMRWPCATTRTLDNLTAGVDHERLSLIGLRNLCDEVRARLMYDRSRDITVHGAHAWACLGWDVGHRDGAGLRHPSEAVAKLFPIPAWRPTMEEQAWFRYGFARQRGGSPRPTIRG